MKQDALASFVFILFLLLYSNILNLHCQGDGKTVKRLTLGGEASAGLVALLLFVHLNFTDTLSIEVSFTSSLFTLHS
ncbi:MAG: hypothetical protein J6B60_03030, partial [Clostridia bacterium]|nr:hypothetical protein [Clostridia bacterium]